MKITTLLLVLFTLIFTACSNSGTGVARAEASSGSDSIVVGVFADVHVNMLPDGTLYATSIDFNDEVDRSEAEDAEKCLFEAQVETVSSDGASFTVLGGLQVVFLNNDDDEYGDDDEDHYQGDDDNDDQEENEGDDEGDYEGEHGEHHGDQEEGAEQDDENDNEDIDNEEIVSFQADQWIEVEGFYSESDGIFNADDIKPHDDMESSVEAFITEVGDGTFTMLGLVISYDDQTFFGEDTDSGDDDSDDS